MDKSQTESVFWVISPQHLEAPARSIFLAARRLLSDTQEAQRVGDNLGEGLWETFLSPRFFLHWLLPIPQIAFLRVTSSSPGEGKSGLCRSASGEIQGKPDAALFPDSRAVVRHRSVGPGPIFCWLNLSLAPYLFCVLLSMFGHYGSKSVHLLFIPYTPSMFPVPFSGIPEKGLCFVYYRIYICLVPKLAYELS